MTTKVESNNGPLPRVLLLIDVYGWAFHTLAKGMAMSMSHRFSFDIAAVADKPDIQLHTYDILHVFGVRTSYHREFERGNCKIMKSLFNTVRDKNLSVEEFDQRFLSDIDALTVPTKSMLSNVQGVRPRTFLCREGIDVSQFQEVTPPEGGLKVSWAGNTSKAYKRFRMAHAACQDMFELHVADGAISRDDMFHFYNQGDVILCTSEYGEGCPRPLLEGMASGCFGVSFPVGIAPEVIDHTKNGLLIEEESPEAIRHALQWCEKNIERIRKDRSENARRMQRDRDWSIIAPETAEVYDYLLAS